jgi:integrase/recombinase XerD
MLSIPIGVEGMGLFRPNVVIHNHTHVFTKHTRSQAMPVPRKNLVLSISSGASQNLWTQALDDFLAYLQPRRELNTVNYYRDQLRLSVNWLISENIPLTEIKGPHLDKYLTKRMNDGIAERTRRHDALTMRVFLRWCKKEGLIETNPLADYEIPRAEPAHVRMPYKEELTALLHAMQEYWQPSRRPAAAYTGRATRDFLSLRNRTIMAGLIETGARISELLNVELDDVQITEGRRGVPAKGQIYIRKTKTDDDRYVPIGADWIDLYRKYLAVRPTVPYPETEKLVFVSIIGTAVTSNAYGAHARQVCKWAKLGRITRHMVRHYTTTTHANVNVSHAQQVAGHADLSTTQIYLHPNMEAIRRTHEEAAPLRGILVNTRSERQKRKRLV